MSDYEVKNVEPIVLSNDIQVRVFRGRKIQNSAGHCPLHFK
jgi:hypothetical protein